MPKAFIVGRVSHAEFKPREGKSPSVTLYIQSPTETVKVFTSAADLVGYGLGRHVEAKAEGDPEFEYGFEIDGPKYTVPVSISSDLFNGRASLLCMLDGPLQQAPTSMATSSAAKKEPAS